MAVVPIADALSAAEEVQSEYVTIKATDGITYLCSRLEVEASVRLRSDNKDIGHIIPEEDKRRVEQEILDQFSSLDDEGKLILEARIFGSPSSNAFGTEYVVRAYRIETEVKL